MTARQYKRMRKWERNTREAYEAGVLDGMDSCFIGESRPDPLLSDFDTNIYLRRYLRHAQEITNATIARSRGRADGFDHALAEMKRADDAEWIDTQVTIGMKQLVDYLRIQDRYGESWAA